jgi:hypothetical protein
MHFKFLGYVEDKTNLKQSGGNIQWKSKAFTLAINKEKKKVLGHGSPQRLPQTCRTC